MTNTLLFNKRENEPNNFIFIISVFVFGMLIGAFSINVCDGTGYYGISDYYNSFINYMKSNSYLELFYSYFLGFTILLLINFSLGLCLIGNYVLFVVLFLYSFAIGSIASFLYCKYSLIGVCYYLISVLPCLFLLTLNYLLSFSNSIKFSKNLFLTFCKSNKETISFSSYLLRYLIHFVLTVVFSLLFAIFSRFLVNLF